MKLMTLELLANSLEQYKRVFQIATASRPQLWHRGTVPNGPCFVLILYPKHIQYFLCCTRRLIAELYYFLLLWGQSNLVTFSLRLDTFSLRLDTFLSSSVTFSVELCYFLSSSVTFSLREMIVRKSSAWRNSGVRRPYRSHSEIMSGVPVPICSI